MIYSDRWSLFSINCWVSIFATAEIATFALSSSSAMLNLRNARYIIINPCFKVQRKLEKFNWSNMMNFLDTLQFWTQYHYANRASAIWNWLYSTMDSIVWTYLAADFAATTVQYCSTYTLQSGCRPVLIETQESKFTVQQRKHGIRIYHTV